MKSSSGRRKWERGNVGGAGAGGGGKEWTPSLHGRPAGRMNNRDVRDGVDGFVSGFLH